MSVETDEVVISKVLQGDSRAYEILVGRYQDAVSRFIWKIIPVEQDREEVCQDVFVKVYFNLDKFRFDAKFSTWLYQIAYRTAVSFNRKKRIETRSFEDDEFVKEEVQNPDQELVRKLLNQQIAKLKLEERTMVTLVYMQDLSIEDISIIVNRPGGTVKSVLHRVRQKLQASIENTMPELVEAMI